MSSVSPMVRLCECKRMIVGYSIFMGLLPELA